MHKIFFPLAVISLAFAACNTTPTASNEGGISRPQHFTERQIQDESKRANAWFDKAYEEYLTTHPQTATYIGDKRNYDRWNDISEAGAKADYDMAKRNLAFMTDSLNGEALDVQTQVSFRLMKRQMQESMEAYEFRNYPYLVNQMFGMQSDIPAFLINMHKIENEKDANAYLTRVESITKLFSDLENRLKTAATDGAVPPNFVLDKVLDASKNIILGAPMQKGKVDNELFADFKNKVNKCDAIDPAMKKTMILGMEKRIMTNFVPAYQSLIKYLETDLKPKSTADAGVWKFKNGAKYYEFCLRRETTTDMTAQQIHELGVKEVARIQGEMKEIMKKVQFKGDLKAFFVFMRDDKQFYYPETPAGKQAYVTKATGIIDTMRTRLPQLFVTLPKAKMVVKQVEPFREKTAGSAFYDAPAPDGSRPGTYYLNTYDMKVQSTYEMEALAYHEGIPGHHMQLAIAQEMTTLPKFRRFNDGFTAYVEGWGLYSEWIPKEMGFYNDPYSDFGRLSMELFRACRLVVDTGLHSQKWTREQGIKYYQDNTSSAQTEIDGMVDRHCVIPGQATAYKIGMIHLQELRAKAKKAMGEKFDIRKFHDVVLTNGALPLNVLDALVDNYIAEGK
jgi:uncharacterized protein (DUF885 family)